MSEPTAWINKERDTITFDNLFPEMTPLYEKREWVGLSEGELSDFSGKKLGSYDLCLEVEALLREKNNG